MEAHKNANVNVRPLAEKLHHRAQGIAQRFKQCEIELLEILEEIDKHKSFYELGFSSLFEYATDGLGLSEDVAYNFINVVPAALKHQVRLKNNGQCAHTDTNGKRCTNMKFLDFHHIIRVCEKWSN